MILTVGPRESCKGLSETLVEGYEQLRSQMLDGLSGSCRGSGLTLLIRNGMVCWMQACRRLVPESQSSSRGKVDIPEDLPMGLRNEVAGLLTTMALSAGMEVVR